MNEVKAFATRLLPTFVSTDVQTASVDGSTSCQCILVLARLVEYKLGMQEKQHHEDDMSVQ